MLPTPHIPTLTIQTVENPEQELHACALLAEVETQLRAIEDSRTAITAPQNAAIKEVNAQAKQVAAPLEAIKATLQGILETYRLLPAAQEKLAKRRALEVTYREAEKEGDMESLVIYGERLNEMKAELPASVPAGDFEVRYRTGLEILSINEAELPERYWKKVIDEKAIKEDIDLIGAVPGVEHRWKYTPTCYAKN